MPRAAFNDYVLPYACVNEPRTDWHPLLAAAVEPILAALPAGATVDDVVRAVNGYDPAVASVWARLGGVAPGVPRSGPGGHCKLRRLLGLDPREKPARKPFGPFLRVPCLL